MPTKSPTRGVAVALHTAGAALANGQVLAIPDSFKNHTIILKGSAGIASGKVQPECADASDYTGTWAPIGGGEVAAVASAEVLIQLTGVYKFLRCRISTVIAGGTVTVTYVGS